MIELFECGIWLYIKGVECCDTKAWYQIDKDRVIVGEFNTFSIINIDKCVIEKIIKDTTLEYVGCFLKLRDSRGLRILKKKMHLKMQFALTLIFHQVL